MRTERDKREGQHPGSIRLHSFKIDKLVKIWKNKQNWHSIGTSICSVQLLNRSNSLRPHGLQHARSPCPSPTPGVNSNSCPSSQWCHPTISSSVIRFSCLQSFPASGSFPKSQLFASGGPSIGASASILVLPGNIRD